MLEELKKNWFVLVVALVLLVPAGFYVKDQTQTKVKGKKIKGEQVVFSIADENYFMKDYEEKLNEILGDSALYQIFERELLSSLELDEDRASDAKLRADTTLTYVKQAQGKAGLESLDKELKALGYEGVDELQEYFKNIAKYEVLVTEHFMNNYDKLFKEYVDTKKPRKVSHILVKYEDPANPTEEELEKVKEIDKALADGKKFAEVAAEKTDDTASKENGGYLGVVDADTTFVDSFKEAMLTLKKGETSDWVESEYGVHLIYVEETDFEKLLSDPEFFSEQSAEHSDEVAKALWNQTQKVEIEFVDPDVEKRLKEFLKVDKEAA